MPDPTRQTISATQTPALFGASPYLTRWMLLRHFIHGDPIDSPTHNRMDWGKKLQPLVLEQAAADLRLEVRPNAGDVYARRSALRLGCTRDAEIFCPDRGPGALETKCVFDYGTWMDEWNGGKDPPRHIEIQLQQQMLVGAGDGSVLSDPFDWGVLAVWVCGEVHYFDRKPIHELWNAMTLEAERFFDDVAGGREGEPFGAPIESELLNRLFKPTPGKVLDLSSEPIAYKIAEDVRMMAAARADRLVAEKTEKIKKAAIGALMKDADELVLVHGIRVKSKLVNRGAYAVKASSYPVYEPYVPENLPDDLLAF
jgi:hypothetical protein